ncbi:hypothetical protein KFL01_24020 [Kocuria flava]|uniref:Uncharacterized protein n=1 Tax=Kocuria flava TaxID=446860 RepID=A0ABQ0X628_9MICC|nr:hypothetical protein KFL01_24020 [Kocuria flava]
MKRGGGAALCASVRAWEGVGPPGVHPVAVRAREAATGVCGGQVLAGGVRLARAHARKRAMGVGGRVFVGPLPVGSQPHSRFLRFCTPHPNRDPLSAPHPHTAGIVVHRRRRHRQHRRHCL